MGFLDKIFGGKKKTKSTLIGAALGGVGGGLIGSGGSDLLFGKKTRPDKLPGPELNPMDPRLNELIGKSQGARNSGIDFFSKQIESEKNFDPVKRAQEMTQRRLGEAERGMLGSREDQLRKTKEMVSRRGLGNSSIGIGTSLGIERDTANRLADAKAGIRGNQSSLQRQLDTDRFNRINQAQSGISSIISGLPQRGFNTPQARPEASRKGGLMDIFAPVAGAAVGGYVGGPQGASAGMQMGSGISTTMRGMA